MIWRRNLWLKFRPPSLRFRAPNWHVPLWVLALGWGLALTGRGLYWLARHPRTTLLLAVVGWLVVMDAVLPATVLACLIGGALCLWWAMWPGSFARWIADPVRLWLRRWLVYRRLWASAMKRARLVDPDMWGGDMPTLRRVASEPGRDLLRVWSPGWTLEQWQAGLPSIGQRFGVRSVRVRRVPDRPQELVLVIARRGTVIRHVTQPDAVEETETVDEPRGAFPRQPRGAA
jgi:hypothetical protein